MRYKRQFKSGGVTKYQAGGPFGVPSWLKNIFGGTQGLNPVNLGPGKTIMPGGNSPLGPRGNYTPPNAGNYNPAPKGTFKPNPKAPIQRPMSQGLKSVGRTAGKSVGRLGPIGLGAGLGYGIGEMLTEDSLYGSFTDWRNASSNRDAARLNRLEADNELYETISQAGRDWRAPMKIPSTGLPYDPLNNALNQAMNFSPPAGDSQSPSGGSGSASPNSSTRDNSSMAPEALDYSARINPTSNLSPNDISGMTVGGGNTGGSIGDIATQVAGGDEADGGFDATGFLQFLPDALNLGAGLFGKDQTAPPTQVSNRAVDMMPSRVNVKPQLNQAVSAYRAILNDPNASQNHKLAAQAALNNAKSQIYADKLNRENQLQANKASVQAQLDSRRAGFREQYRQDKMASEANLGLTGNFARNALSNISNKLLQRSVMKNQQEQSKRDRDMLLRAYPESTQRRLNRDNINGK